ncbi:MAG: hypothetical protein R6V05_04455 [Candidatus Brocadiia bacterium]
MGSNSAHKAATAQVHPGWAFLLVVLILPLFLLVPMGCHREQVRLRASAGSNRYVWRHLIETGRLQESCRELLYTIEPPLGYAQARTGQPQSFVFNARLRWNAAVRPLCAELVELARLHNQARVSLAEFEQVRKSLDAAVAELEPMKVRLEDALDTYQTVRGNIIPEDTTAPLVGVPPPALSALQTARTEVDNTLAEATELAAALLSDQDAD